MSVDWNSRERSKDTARSWAFGDCAEIGAHAVANGTGMTCVG